MSHFSFAALEILFFFCFVSFCFLCFWQFSIYVDLWVYPTWSSLTFLNVSLIFSIIWKPFSHYFFFSYPFCSSPLLKLPFCIFEMLSCPMGFWGFIFLHFFHLFLFLKLNNSTWLIFSLFSCAVDLVQQIFHLYYCIFELYRVSILLFFITLSLCLYCLFGESSIVIFFLYSLGKVSFSSLNILITAHL